MSIFSRNSYLIFLFSKFIIILIIFSCVLSNDNQNLKVDEKDDKNKKLFQKDIIKKKETKTKYFKKKNVYNKIETKAINNITKRKIKLKDEIINEKLKENEVNLCKNENAIDESIKKNNLDKAINKSEKIKIEENINTKDFELKNAGKSNKKELIITNINSNNNPENNLEPQKTIKQKTKKDSLISNDKKKIKTSKTLKKRIKEKLQNLKKKEIKEEIKELKTILGLNFIPAIGLGLVVIGGSFALINPISIVVEVILVIIGLSLVIGHNLISSYLLHRKLKKLKKELKKKKKIHLQNNGYLEIAALTESD